MIAVGFDCESHLIKPGLLAPRMVCASWAWGDKSGGYVTALELRDDGLIRLRGHLRDPQSLIVGANLPYDFGVAAAEDPKLLPLIFDAYDTGRVRCVQTHQKLIDVALGMRKFRRVNGVVTPAKYSLADLVALYFNEHLEKIDTWRLRYAFLDGVPIEEWPEDAVNYAVSDAVQALRVHEAQLAEELEIWGEPLPNDAEQQRAAWALHLMSMWGIRAEASRVDYFVEHCEREIAIMRDALADTKIFKPDGSRTMTEIRRRVVESLERQGLPVPMTDPSSKYPDGQVQTDKDALLSTDDPMLHVLSKSMTFAKHLGQWGPVLRAAVERPVCCRYEVLGETGRTASSGSEGQEGTNIQNPPRDGDVRPAIVPRPGHVFCSTDADTIELRAHAQNCLELVGESVMAARLIEQARSGAPDLHEVLAGGIIGIDPFEVQRLIIAGDSDAGQARQFAKIPNFGFPGGLGAPTFVAYAAGQLSKEAYLKWFGPDREEAVEKARKHREIWFETFPENRDYFKIVGAMIDRETGYGTVEQLMSKRIRGGVRFTAAANGFFQGRVADAMKEILWCLAYECYTGRSTGGTGKSILYGSRPVMFLHDEPILEHPEDGTESDRAERQRQIVVRVLSKWLPDIPCTSSAVLTRRWHKGAKPLRINDMLVPVKPLKIKSADGKDRVKWVHDVGEEGIAA